MSPRFKLLLPWGVIGICVTVYLLRPFALGLGQTEISSQASPDGIHTVFEFRSNDDGAGHAPYGTSLVLAKGKTLSRPEDGYVFFAGYCNGPLAYAWRDNRTVTVSCRGADKPVLRTHAVLAQGISIEVKVE